MALRKGMPTRDPGRPGERPEDVTEYDAARGGWHRSPAEQRPLPGAPNGTSGRLRKGARS